MSSKDRIIQKILQGNSVSYKEAEKILLDLGFQLAITASHHIFRKKGY